MKLFESLHNPQSRKYGIYYVVVLSCISLILILEDLNLFHLTMYEQLSVYFEGFFSLYMISRHEFAKTFMCNFSDMKLFHKI
jgi:hypothetical protein